MTWPKKRKRQIQKQRQLKRQWQRQPTCSSSIVLQPASPLVQHSNLGKNVWPKKRRIQRQRPIKRQRQRQWKIHPICSSSIGPIWQPIRLVQSAFNIQTLEKLCDQPKAKWKDKDQSKDQSKDKDNNKDSRYAAPPLCPSGSPLH